MHNEIEETWEFKKVVKLVIGGAKAIDHSCSESISNSVSKCKTNLDCIMSIGSFSEQIVWIMRWFYNRN